MYKCIQREELTRDGRVEGSSGNDLVSPCGDCGTGDASSTIPDCRPHGAGGYHDGRGPVQRQGRDEADGDVRRRRKRRSRKRGKWYNVPMSHVKRGNSRQGGYAAVVSAGVHHHVGTIDSL